MSAYRRPLLALLMVFAAAALFAQKGPDEAKIDDCVTKKTAVAFAHGKHAATIACPTCHHTQADLTTDTQKVETCASCHVAPEKAETPKCAEMAMTKNPFHIGCVGCHKAEKAKGNKVAPTACDGCHPKAAA
jgi:hypothetical protein